MTLFKPIPYIALLFLSQFSFGQADHKHSVKSLREDFTILRGVLEESHAGIYWYRTKTEMDKYFDASYDSIDHEMTELEYYRLVAPLISRIGCGHTWIATSQVTQEKIWENGRVLPMKLKFINKKAYCLQNNSYDSISILPGDEILSVNNYSIDSLLGLSNKFSHGDAFIQTGKSLLLEKVFNQFYTQFIDQPDEYLIKFRNRSGEMRQIVVVAQTLKEIELISARRYPVDKSLNDVGNIKLQFLRGDSIALLRIKEFDDWKSGGRKVRFKSQLEDCFLKIDSVKSENLVIDVRNNDGGNEKYGLDLYSYLTDKPFRGYKQIDLRTTRFRFKKYSNTSRFEYLLIKLFLKNRKLNDTTYLVTNDKATKEFPPYHRPFKGKIYIMVNGGSFSTTSDFTALSKSNKIATFVGEETGGSYLGNTSNYSFLITLPNTKIKVNVPVTRYQTNVTINSNIGRGTIPDYETVYSIDDIIQGVDKDIDTVLGLIKK